MNGNGLKLLLIFIILLCGGYVAWQLGLKPVPSPLDRPAAREEAKGRSDASPHRINLAQMNPERTPLPTRFTNLFRGIERPKPPAPKARPRPVVPKTRPTIRVQPPLPTPQGPPPIAVTYVGQLTRRGETVLFLKQGNDIFIAGEGDRFGPDNGYRLVTIGPETARIDRASGEGVPLRLPLVKAGPAADPVRSPAFPSGPRPRQPFSPLPPPAGAASPADQPME